LVAAPGIANEKRSDCDIMALDCPKINSTTDGTRRSFELARNALKLRFPPCRSEHPGHSDKDLAAVLQALEVSRSGFDHWQT
jgi:hypothetical protein